MKAFFKYFFFLVMIVPGLLLVSCGDDDDNPTPSCTVQDFVGTYGGTFGGDNVTATISIDSDGDLEVNISSVFFPYFILVPEELNGCKAENDPQFLTEFDLTLNGDNLSGTLDGSNLNLTKGDLPEEDCAFADWLGTYTGSCGTADVTVLITDFGDGDIEAEIEVTEGGSLEGTGGIFTPVDCEASFIDATNRGISMTLDGSNLMVSLIGIGALSDCGNSTTVSK